MNYEELVKALRCETEDTDCESCRYYKDLFCHVRSMQHDAAAAIEALEAEVAELKLVNMEIFEDLPKRGKWSHMERVDRSWVTDEIFGFVVQCSVCGNKNIGESIYCPNCGAKMEVQE